MNELSTLTVAELIEILSRFDDDTPVVISSDSGDYWGRIVADSIGEYDVDEAEITWSSYHDKWKVVVDAPADDDVYDDDETLVAVVIGPLPQE